MLAMDWVISEPPTEYVDDKSFNNEFIEDFTKDASSLKTYLI
jgi:hypothetical protein